jgi:hypothetical protein
MLVLNRLYMLSSVAVGLFAKTRAPKLVVELEIELEVDLGLDLEFNFDVEEASISAFLLANIACRDLLGTHSGLLTTSTPLQPSPLPLLLPLLLPLPLLLLMVLVRVLLSRGEIGTELELDTVFDEDDKLFAGVRVPVTPNMIGRSERY